MIYCEYLNLLSQINFGKKAILNFKDVSIHVNQEETGFILSGKVGEEVPLELTTHQLDAPGSNLILKDDGIYFTQEVKSLDQFLKFKILIPNFLDLLQFWRGVIQDLEREPLRRL